MSETNRAPHRRGRTVAPGPCEPGFRSSCVARATGLLCRFQITAAPSTERPTPRRLHDRIRVLAGAALASTEATKGSSVGTLQVAERRDQEATPRIALCLCKVLRLFLRETSLGTPCGSGCYGWNVAIGIAGSGRVGTIALQECDRRPAGAVQRSRTAEFGRKRSRRLSA
jgi:hypothetical protein